MSSSSGVGAPEIIGWVVTGILFAGNMFWNLLNRRHTNTLAGQIRTDQYRKEVWDRHRGKIEERLEDFVDFITSLPATVLALPGDSAPIPMETYDLNLNELHDRLSRALDAADKSAYCDGALWTALAYGHVDNGESSWDRLLDQMVKAGRSKKRSTQVTALKQLPQWAHEIELVIRQQIQQNDFQYQP